MAKFIKAAKLNNYKGFTVVNNTAVPFEGLEPVVINNMVCIPYETCQPRKPVTMVYDLIVWIKAATDKAIEAGALVYWDNTKKVITTDAKGNLLCGVAIQKKVTGNDWVEIHFLGPLANLYTPPSTPPASPPGPEAAGVGVGG